MRGRSRSTKRPSPVPADGARVVLAARPGLSLGLGLALALVLTARVGAEPGAAAEPGARVDLRAWPDPCAAWVATWAGGRVFWIDGDAPGATDRGPGTVERPWRTPDPVRQKGRLAPGDAVIFRAGTYRAAIRPADAGLPDRPITFAACPDAIVTISGADPLVTPWVRSGNVWTAAGMAARGSVGGQHDRHLVVAGEAVLRTIAADVPLEPGTMHVEGLSGDLLRLTVRLPGETDPNEARMYIGRRGTLFGPPEASRACPSDPGAGGYRLVGLRFTHAANPAQHGAVCLGGTGVTAEDIEVTWTNGQGIEMVGRSHVLRRSAANDNGQAGIGGQCEDCLLEDVQSHRNNWRGHSRFWEAGGGKWTDTRRTVFRRYRAEDNDGVGLWFDVDATDNLIDDARISGSEVAALMFELRSDHNRVVGGRFAGTRYRSWSGSGILQQAAGATTIEGALIEENEGSGLWVRTDGRVATGTVTVRGSTFVRNAAAGRDHDHDVRLDMDVPPGAAEIGFDFEDNMVYPRRARAAFGLARDRESAPRPTRPIDYWGRDSALQVQRVGPE